MTFFKFQLEYFCNQAELHATLDHCVASQIQYLGIRIFFISLPVKLRFGKWWRYLAGQLSPLCKRPRTGKNLHLGGTVQTRKDWMALPSQLNYLSLWLSKSNFKHTFCWSCLAFFKIHKKFDVNSSPGFVRYCVSKVTLDHAHSDRYKY